MIGENLLSFFSDVLYARVMDSGNGSTLIGIDGGGTACRLALLRQGKRVELSSGSANVTTDFEAATGIIRDGLAALAEKAGMPLQEIWACPAYLGLAGVVDETETAAIAEALPLAHAWVEDDRRSTVVGALGDAHGTVAAIGTGSFLARRSASGMAFAGGWGLKLGDEASGAWLGRGLLQKVLMVADGFAKETSLTRQTLASFDQSTGAIIRYGQTVSPAGLARLAPRVIQAAQVGDVAARDLMAAGAGYVMNGITKLGWRPGDPLCLIGGVAPAYEAYLSAAAQTSLRPAKGTALDGALRLAADLAANTRRFGGG